MQLHHHGNRIATSTIYNPPSRSNTESRQDHQQQQWQRRPRKRRSQQQETNTNASSTEVYYRFALIPKNTCDGLFFQDILFGCQDRAAEEEGINVVCECVSRYNNGSSSNETMTQGELIANLTAQHKSRNQDYYHGFAVSVLNEEDVHKPFALAIDAGIPVVTVDSDAPNSARLAYIGTDDFQMGKEMANILLQLRPEGGVFAIVSAPSPNLVLRVLGVRQQLKGTRWRELDQYSPLVTGTPTNVTALMSEWVESNPDLRAILPVYLHPMGDNPQAWEDFAIKYEDRNLTYVGTDWTAAQLELLIRGYVHGLVGQLPYEMGQQVTSTLLRFQNETVQLSSTGEVVDTKFDSTIMGTNLIEILRVPLDLPPIDFRYNYLGHVTIFGYITFAIVALLSIGFVTWTFIDRHKYVVRASQPTFLYIICAGVLLAGSSIITFGMDDEKYEPQQCDRACMASPWLFSIGFVLIFSALFSKTWRVNQLFHNPNKFRRLKVTTRDVILPMIVLLGLNVAILACWTALNPLRFRRQLTSETDLWNRSIASYGMCIADESSMLYWALLAVVNIGALVIALVQAYQARDIQTEFSESKYIALVFASMAQACLVGGPILFIDRHDPTVLYVLQTILVFLLATVILLLIFVPKILHQRERDIQERKKHSKRRIQITGLAADCVANGDHLKNDDIHSPPSRTSSESESVGLKLKVWKKVSHNGMPDKSHSESCIHRISASVEDCPVTGDGAVPAEAETLKRVNGEHLPMEKENCRASGDGVGADAGNNMDEYDDETKNE